MGIKERHERDREAVRRAILDAAKDLFVTEGYHNVSIRKVAERIEYSPAAIYSYFASKDDIFFALAEEGFRLLGDPGTTDAAEQAGRLEPLERLRAIFWRFYEFSRQHPQYFALMFVDRSVPRIGREYERFAFAREIKANCLAHIQQCINGGLLPQAVSPQVVMRLMTSGLLGIAVLRLSERLGGTEDADLLAEDALNLMLAGLRSGAIVKSTGSFECGAAEQEEDLQAS